MSTAEILLVNLVLILVLQSGLWLLSIPWRNASIVDVFWGVGFVVIVWASYGMADSPHAQLGIGTLDDVVGGAAGRLPGVEKFRQGRRFPLSGHAREKADVVLADELAAGLLVAGGTDVGRGASFAVDPHITCGLDVVGHAGSRGVGPRLAV